MGVVAAMGSGWKIGVVGEWHQVWEIPLGLDPDAGLADLEEIIDVASASDVAAALRQVGVPGDEADALAPGLWERRWRPDGATQDR